MNVKSNLLLLSGVFTFITAPSYADTIPMEAKTCTTCHGAEGLGTAKLAPMLAGLNADYIEKQLELFRSGERKNPLMAMEAGKLDTKEKREAVATYFSSLPTYEFHNLEKRGDAADIQTAARKLVYQGDWERDIPACATCHGASGMGVGPFPRLASQHADYIANQLNAWKNGTRKGDDLNMMENIASKLTNEEIQQLSYYFASFRY
ncbi:c-type cytochrome [Vibrio sp.]|nr:c-type cytochrome [Vibrio sp.]